MPITDNGKTWVCTEESPVPTDWEYHWEHPDMKRTGNFHEYWTGYRTFEYYCPWCKKMYWRDDDENEEIERRKKMVKCQKKYKDKIRHGKQYGNMAE